MPASLDFRVTDQPARPLWAGRTLALLGILLVALNLRTAVAALSPIAAEIDAGHPALGRSPSASSACCRRVCFALFGIFSPVFTRRFGLEPVLIAALVAIVAGHTLRGLAGSLPMLLLGSAITFAGLGVGNVLLPPLVKKYFPDRVGLMTTLYATALSVSTFIPPLLAVPVADAAGWQFSLGMWAIFGCSRWCRGSRMIVHRRAGVGPLPKRPSRPSWRASGAHRSAGRSRSSSPPPRSTPTRCSPGCPRCSSTPRGRRRRRRARCSRSTRRWGCRPRW